MIISTQDKIDGLIYSPYLSFINGTFTLDIQNKKAFWQFWRQDKKPLEIPNAVIIRDSNFNETYIWEEFEPK